VPASGDDQLEARVTRYNIVRFRLGQALVPAALIATVLSRRVPELVPLSAALVTQGLAAIAFVSAVRWLGWQPLRSERSAIWFGTTGLRVKRDGMREWTVVDRTARIYGSDVSYRLTVRPGRQSALECLLRPVFGKPTELKRRGTKRARLIALAVAALGLASVVASFVVFDTLALTIVGTPALVFGIAMFGALSQRIRT
jgi:hypothetical protein